MTRITDTVVEVLVFLITGGTGQLGRAVVEQMLERVEASSVAILARDSAKAQDLADRGVDVRIGDYDRPESLARAMRGVRRLVLIASNEPERRMPQHRAVIDVAVDAQVELIGFASRSLRDVEASANRLMHDYFDTEALITESQVPALIFRNALYLDTLVNFLGPDVLATGLRAPAGDGSVAYALRREMGEAIANAMIDAPPRTRTYVLAAPRAYSMADVARGLSEASGQSVSYEPVSIDDYLAAAVARGLPEPMARRTLGFFSDVRDGQLSETSDDLATLLNRAPVPLASGLAETFGL